MTILDPTPSGDVWLCFSHSLLEASKWNRMQETKPSLESQGSLPPMKIYLIHTVNLPIHSFIHSPVLNDTLQDIQERTGTDLAFKQPPALVHCPRSGLCKLHCKGSVDQCSIKFTAFSKTWTVERVLGFLFCIYYLSYRVILKYQLPCHIP